MNHRDSKRAIVHYRGNVQGVGFRATAVGQLDGAPVVGWVRNEPDGGVRLEAEGPRDEVERFLERVLRALAHRIDDEQVDWREPRGTETTFGVRY